MKWYSLSVVLCAACILAIPGDLHAQEKSSTGLPKQWNGVWKGTCTTTYRDGRKLDFGLELYVAPIEGREASTWKIVYDGDIGRQVRDYEILVVDRSKGHFRIDEKNGIVLDAFLLKDTLHSRFTIDDNNVECSYRLIDSSIEVIMIASRVDPLATTQHDSSESKVTTFDLISVQRGMLKRKPTANP